MKDRFRILNLKAPSDADEPATKQYADSHFFYRDGSHPMTGDVNMNNNKIENLPTPTADGNAATKKYVDDNKVDGSVFLKLDGTRKMTGNLDMNNKQINNLPLPTSSKQPTTLGFTNLKYLHLDGTVPMGGNLNMNNKKITHLLQPTDNTDAATKKYVDDNSVDVSNYLKRDGTSKMVGNLNMDNHKIVNLYMDPTSKTDATNKEYFDNLMHHSQVQPSHIKDQFAFLMTNAAQWTDELGNSFVIEKIADLSPTQGNMHTYNHRVIYTTIKKNSQGGYKYKMAINAIRLLLNIDYTLCTEILNTDYQLWHKSQVSVDKATSKGLTIGNVSVRKFSHRYTDSSNQPQFMYYHRMIINFRKTAPARPYFLHILVNIPQDGSDLAVYPANWKNNNIIAYGIMGSVSNIDPDKVYDYHTAFDIHPTEVSFNVNISANGKAIRNINLERNSASSAATVAMVKELIPYTTNNIYRQYFEEFYDFSDADKYKISTTSSGVSFTGLNPNMQFIPKNIDKIKVDGLFVDSYGLTMTVPHIQDYTICLVMSFLEN